MQQFMIEQHNVELCWIEKSVKYIEKRWNAQFVKEKKKIQKLLSITITMVFS